MGSFPYEAYGCIISIDFGTTFSGSCYAIIYDRDTKVFDKVENDPKNIQTADLDREKIIDIDQWNENKGAKTPTVVVYDEHMHLSHWGKAATKHIATTIGPHDIVLEKFKLKLPKSVSQKGAVLVSSNMEQDDEEVNKHYLDKEEDDYYQFLRRFDHLKQPLSDWQKLAVLLSSNARQNDDEAIGRSVSEAYPEAYYLLEALSDDHDLLYRLAKDEEEYYRCLERFNLKMLRSAWQKHAVLVSGNKKQDINMRAAIDYFLMVYGHTLRQIHTTRPISNIKFTKDNIRFVITVPAIWNDVERTIIRDVALSAGLISEKDHESRLIIINESLAATLYCERESDKDKIKIGTNYIVCDAGGENVDIASFVATKALNDNKSFPRCQLTAGSGDRCGSTYLDERMKELLMRVLFRPNDMSIYHSEEQKKEFEDLGFITYDDKQKKELNAIVADLLKQFNEEEGFKYTFPAPVSPENRNGSDDDTESEDKSSSESEYETDEDEDDEGADDDPYRKNVTTFKIETRSATDMISFLPTSEARYVKAPDTDIGAMLLQVPYEKMRALVFDPVINTTIDLLDKQIKKIQDPVATTFLVGGFGRNPYLHYRIKDKFKILDDAGNVIGYRCGELSDDDRGNLAAIRGALHYGLDGVRQAMPTEIIPIDISLKNLDLTICIDVRRDRLLYSCRVLNSKIPESLHAKNSESILLEKTFRLGGNMEDLEQHFRLGFAMLCERLQKSRHITDVDKIRFCLLLNPFVSRLKHCRKRIRQTAVDSSLINVNDSADRLLYIDYSDAVAINYQSTPEALTDQYKNSYRMLITNGDGFIEVSAHQHVLFHNVVDKNQITNIRKLTSSIQHFNTLEKLTIKIDSLIATRAVAIHCSSVSPHDRYNKSYFHNLKKHLSEFLKTCHLADRSSIHEFTIYQNGCCKVSIASKQLWELLFRPVLDDLIKTVNNIILNNTLVRSIQFKNINMVNNPVDTPKETSKLFQQYIAKNLAALWKIDGNRIQHTDNNAMEGAALFAAEPESYHERFARRTYAVAIEAVKRSPFEAAVQEEIHNLAQNDATYDQIYKVESANAFPTSHTVQLYFEETSSQLITVRQYVHADMQIFIGKGERFSEKEHLRGGIRKRFYALEECIVYANIYTTTEPCNESELKSLPKSKLQRRHRFEIYLKKDTKSTQSQPIYFEIHLYTKSNEILFDVQLYPKVNSGYLQFRLPDSILVSNVLEDDSELTIPEGGYSKKAPLYRSHPKNNFLTRMT